MEATFLWIRVSSTLNSSSIIIIITIIFRSEIVGKPIIRIQESLIIIVT